MLYAIIGVLVIILDQATKYWAASNLVAGETVEFIPGLVQLQNVHNTGAAFSFLSDSNAGKIFVILAFAFAALVVVGLITNFISGKLARWCAVFVAAGGIGNAIDRLLYDYVQDMIKISFVNFPVFNVADIFITVFCLLFIICIIFGGKASRQEDGDYYDDYADEQEEAPVSRSRTRGRAAAMAEEDYEEEAPRKRRNRTDYEEEDAYEEPSRSARRAAEEEEKSSRRERRAKYNDEFEQYKATRDARRAAEESAAPARSRAAVSDDPFNKNSTPSAPAAAPTSRGASTGRSWSDEELAEMFGQPAAKKQQTRTVSVQPTRVQQPAAAKPAAAPQSRPAAAPQPKAAPAPAAAPKPAPAPAKASSASDTDFNLDDILAEFK